VITVGLADGRSGEGHCPARF